MQIKPRVLVQVALFLAACALLYYGSVMLFLVPGSPHEAYFQRNRVIFGVLPVLLSLGLLVAVGRVSKGLANERRSVRGGIVNLFAYAIVAVVVVHLGIMVLAGFLQRSN